MVSIMYCSVCNMSENDLSWLLCFLSTGTSVSGPLRIQAPSSQPPWDRNSTRTRDAQALLLQQHRDVITQRGNPSTSQSSAAPGETISGVRSSSRTLSSTVSPLLSLPESGNTAAFPSIKASNSAQHRAELLAHHRTSQAAVAAAGKNRRKSYVCRTCGKAFPSLSNLGTHERVHTGERPFRCDTCGKHFSEAGNLKKHQRVHTGEKPFSCDQCGKRFAWICNLKTHQQSCGGLQAAGHGGDGLSAHAGVWSYFNQKDTQKRHTDTS